MLVVVVEVRKLNWSFLLANAVNHANPVTTFTCRFNLILKDINDLNSKSSHINIIGVDVGKGLLDNMIVNDMNNCAVN